MDSIAVPVTLVGLSLLCTVDLYRHERTRYGRIALPEDDDDDIAHPPNGAAADGNEQREEEEDDEVESERRQREKREQLEVKVEGTPVHEDRWWLKTRLKKLAAIILLSLLDAVACLELGFDVTTGRRGKYSIVEDALMVVFWTHLTILAALSFTRRTLSTHWRYTVYLTCLTLLASTEIWARLLIPSSNISLARYDTLVARESAHLLPYILSIVSGVLSLLAFLVIGTTKRAPPYHFISPYTYSVASDFSDEPSGNVAENVQTSVIGLLLFDWVTPVITAGFHKEQMGLDDLPHLSAAYRTIALFQNFRTSASRSVTKALSKMTEPSRFALDLPKDGLGCAPWLWNRLLWRLVVVNKLAFFLNCTLAFLTAMVYYLPVYFLNKVVEFLQNDHKHQHADRRLGYAYCFGLFLALVLDGLGTAQMWYISNCMLASRIRVQLNSVIFAKTLKRKDVMSGSSVSDEAAEEDKKPHAPMAGQANKVHPATQSKRQDDNAEEDAEEGTETEADAFKSKTQVLNLFSVDCDRVADSAALSFTLIDAPVELVIGSLFLYQLIGYAGIIGIAVTILFLPLNHYASMRFAVVQDRLMAARDKRVSLMNEVLSSIRYIKFMAYERPFEQRILKARDEELRQQRSIYMLEVLWDFIWGASPIACIVVSFYVYTKIMERDLTPAVAFTSLAIFNELRFAINALPDTFVSALQCYVSLLRIEKYLATSDVENVGTDADLVALKPPSNFADLTPPVAFINATITWPSVDSEDNSNDLSPGRSGVRTPATNGGRTPGGRKFTIPDLHVEFPVGELSLVCGPLGSGKTLLLLALLGEADLLAGQILCPRSPVNTISITSDMYKIEPEDWLMPVCAYVPQSSWLLNASIQDNILFGLPLDLERYNATLEACSLLSDLAILEDGDQTEIGEKGVNLSGGQKARVSLARAVYSRASYLFLDDVLSAVDAHTASHLFQNCLKGPLLRGRTVILVSHHVQLCAPGAAYIVHLDNGMAAFNGPTEEYMQNPLYLKDQPEEDDEKEKAEERRPKTKLTNKNLTLVAEQSQPKSSSSASSLSEFDTSDESSSEDEIDKPHAPPRKLIEDEARATGHVSSSVWFYYLKMNGSALFWAVFATVFIAQKGSEVLETWWLRVWSQSYDLKDRGQPAHSVNYYLTLYAIIALAAVLIETFQFFVLYMGGLRASTRMYKVVLRATLRAPLRFFDTTALGRLLNRFGKDFEQVDAQLPDNIGKTTVYLLGVLTTLVTVAYVSPIFILAFALLCIAYSHYARLYAMTAREMRRLDSITKSPVFSLYGEAIAGVTVIRAFGAPARFMLTQIHRVDKNIAFYYFLWASNRWLSVRFQLLSALLVGVTAFILLSVAKNIDASIAGFALTFALSVSSNILFLVRRYTALELSMVAVERIKEYTEIQQEPAEIIEPRPPAGWPTSGEVVVDSLSLRYAPELPRVLHSVSFKINPGEKVGIVGATGSGKSSLALSFFRFVEADEGSIVIDGIDISKVGLQDLRSKLTIIPQDPTILSGTIRSTLDPLDEYDDHDIFDALKRARLLPAEPAPTDNGEEVNYNPFYNLDTEVSEQGQNFSAGERQLMCLARALLIQHPLILMDEATSSVDYETDALITATIAEEFKRSSLLVIAHRLRTVIGFDKILVLDAGRVAEFDSPAKLIADPESRFHALCKAAGRREFKILTRLSKKENPQRAVLKRRKTKRQNSARSDAK